MDIHLGILGTTACTCVKSLIFCNFYTTFPNPDKWLRNPLKGTKSNLKLVNERINVYSLINIENFSADPPRKQLLWILGTEKLQMGYLLCINIFLEDNGHWWWQQTIDRSKKKKRKPPYTCSVLLSCSNASLKVRH